jgi:hypothetical protein
MTPEQIKTLEENLAIAIEALKMYADPSYPKELTEIAHDALVKISANNVATKYHNTLKNLAESEKKDLLENKNESE